MTRRDVHFILLLIAPALTGCVEQHARVELVPSVNESLIRPGVRSLRQLTVSSSDPEELRKLSNASCVISDAGDVYIFGRRDPLLIHWSGHQARHVTLSEPLQPAGAAWDRWKSHLLVIDAGRNRLVSVDSIGKVSLESLFLAGQAPRIIIPVTSSNWLIGGERWISEKDAHLIGYYEQGMLQRTFFAIDSIAVTRNAFVGDAVLLAPMDSNVIAAQPTSHNVSIYRLDGLLIDQIGSRPQWFAEPPPVTEDQLSETSDLWAAQWTPATFLHFTGRAIILGYTRWAPNREYVLQVLSLLGKELALYAMTDRPLCGVGRTIVTIRVAAPGQVAFAEVSIDDE